MELSNKTISSVLEKNYSILMPVFYEMQTEYLASLNIIYDDLDASMVAMVLTNELYKKKINSNGSGDDIGFKNFYNMDKYYLSSSALKINKIASVINVPRETVRRKRDKLIKDKILILDKKKRVITLNTDKIDRRILDLQIENLTKFLSKFTDYFISNNFISKMITREQIKRDLDKKFLIYLTKFLDFQISYFSNLKKHNDIESIFIVLLCILNSTSQLRKDNKVMNYKDVIQNIQNMQKVRGLNVSSIADITRIPRTTVIRKINKLEKDGYLYRDKFKRYFTADLTKNKTTNALTPLVHYNREIITSFFIDCFDIFKKKN